MSAIYRDGHWYGSDSSGHMIKDAGTDLYPREGLNFTGFDVSDDPTNDETDITPHRLTQAELMDIVTPLPSVPLDMPVMFDETGVERIVGWYKRSSDGKKKPLYEKDIKTTVPNNSNGTVDTTIDVSSLNIEYGHLTQQYVPYSGQNMADYFNATSGWNVTCCWYNKINNEIVIRNYMAINANQVANVTLQFTRTTDSWQ